MRKEFLLRKFWLILGMAICAGSLTSVSAQRRDRDRDCETAREGADRPPQRVSER